MLEIFRSQGLAPSFVEGVAKKVRKLSMPLIRAVSQRGPGLVGAQMSMESSGFMEESWIL